MTHDTGKATRRLILEPLTAEAFAAFGDVVDPPAEAAPALLAESLGGQDGAHQPRLSFSCAPAWTLPLEVREMERHNRSSQCFVPMDVARWVILVAPDRGGRPDTAGLRAFLVRGDQAVNYHRGTWHHPVRALDRPGRFAVLMWTTGRKQDDEEWATLPQPVTIAAA
ncbi:ureidoglycolate lyase [Falsiroseomonas tokyonensis]|uniref:Ureidoglycolate lyase n=1 Tax=Falsiroseomonas tokyonensis TaxID=430521 RepID=A0ABV7BU40_9PROT|nr:ureidoglycolate lyase [Falsiroseomonas tokyonensis]MBU8539164.1 ureidoglycolate lyase [Falsiroseomonas tokyonensis]